MRATQLAGGGEGGGGGEMGFRLDYNECSFPLTPLSPRVFSSTQLHHALFIHKPRAQNKRSTIRRVVKSRPRRFCCYSTSPSRGRQSVSMWTRYPPRKEQTRRLCCYSTSPSRGRQSVSMWTKLAGKRPRLSGSVSRTPSIQLSSSVSSARMRMMSPSSKVSSSSLSASQS